jgi:hypothetical protein
MGVRGEFADQEFLDNVLDACDADADGGAFDDEADAAAVGRGIVGVGETVGHGSAEDAGVVELPVVVVAFADYGVGEGVEDAGFDGAIAFIEVAGVLLEEGGQDGVSEERSGEEGPVGGGVAFAIALRAFAPTVDVVGLLDAGGDSVEDERHGIDHGAEGELVFLFGVERLGVGDVADVEVGEDAEDALLFLEIDLSFGYVGAGGGDADVGGGGWGEDDGGEVSGLAGGEFTGGLRGGESGGGDGEGEGAGGDGGEVELTVGGGGGFCGGKAGLGEDDAGVGDGGVVGVGDGAGEGGCGDGCVGLSGLRRGCIRRFGGEGSQHPRQQEEGKGERRPTSKERSDHVR